MEKVALEVGLQGLDRSFKRQVDRQTVIHQDNGILYNNKKKGAIKLLKDLDESYAYC